MHFSFLDDTIKKNCKWYNVNIVGIVNNTWACLINMVNIYLLQTKQLEYYNKKRIERYFTNGFSNKDVKLLFFPLFPAFRYFLLFLCCFLLFFRHFLLCKFVNLQNYYP